jgi:hypothetical protein
MSSPTSTPGSVIDLSHSPASPNVWPTPTPPRGPPCTYRCLHDLDAVIDALIHRRAYEKPAGRVHFRVGATTNEETNELYAGSCADAKGSAENPWSVTSSPMQPSTQTPILRRPGKKPVRRDLSREQGFTTGDSFPLVDDPNDSDSTEDSEAAEIDSVTTLWRGACVTCNLTTSTQATVVTCQELRSVRLDESTACVDLGSPVVEPFSARV